MFQYKTQERRQFYFRDNKHRAKEGYGQGTRFRYDTVV